MTTKDTAQDAQEAPAAPAPQDEANNHHAGETVEVQGQDVPVVDEDADLASPGVPWHASPPEGPEAPDVPESPEGPEVSDGPDEPAVKVDVRQLELRRELLGLLPSPDAPAEILQAFVDRLMGRDRLGAELVLPQERVEINREIDCEIYAHRTGRLQGSPTPRVYLTLTFDGVRHAKLSGLLGANLKGSIRVNVIDLQAPLEEDEEEDLPDAGVARQEPLAYAPPVRQTPGELIDERDAGAAGRLSHATDGQGNVYKPHGYAPSPLDAQKCALCGSGESHDVHAGQKRQTARRALARRAETLLEHVWTPVRQEGEPAAPETCAYCDLPSDSPIHNARADELPTFADRVVYWRDVEGLAEAVAWARADEDAGAEDPRCLPATESDNLARRLIEGIADEAAGAGVGEALETPIPDSDLTDEQREARDRLAKANG